MIFSVKVVSAPNGRKPPAPVRIFSALHAHSRGIAAIGELAALQRGIVERGQLIEAGITRGMLRTMCGNGVLYPVLPRVYAVGTPELQPLAKEIAAMLHLRHDAVVSHSSAAALWGLVEEPDTVQVTIVGRGLRARDGLAFYRVSQLDSRDVRRRQGLPVTAPARTLIDLAATSTTAGLGSAAGEARAKRLVTDPDFDAALQRAPLRTGTRALKALRATPAGQLLTRSGLERRLLALLTAAGLPLPITNTRVNGHEVDAYWPGRKLILEVDSWLYHGSREAFGRDRARDQDHHAHGDRPIRVTDEQLVGEPLHVAARIAEALAQNS
jgi:AbiEi antitoxin C-terminal domain